MSVNKAIILGRLGQDPELKTLPSGNMVCNLSIATSEKWKDKNSGLDQEKTEWHRVTVFGKIAENCGKYLTKGSQAYVEGKITTRSWEDDSGNKRYSTEIVASSVQFIGAKSDSSSGSENKPVPMPSGIDADSIPF